MGLAQRGRPQIRLALVVAPSGKGDLARVPAEVVATLGEDGVQVAVAHVQGHQHCRVGAPLTSSAIASIAVRRTPWRLSRTDSMPSFIA